VQLAAEGHEDAEPGGLGCSCGRDGVGEVCRAIGAGRARRADRARQDDRLDAAVQDVAQHRRLLERVGAVRDDDAAPGGRLGKGGAGDLERVGGAEMCARHAEDRARPQIGDLRERGDGGEQRVRVERGPRARARHGDRAARREHRDGSRDGGHKPSVFQLTAQDSARSRCYPCASAS
jgi:hypothetical protein